MRLIALAGRYAVLRFDAEAPLPDLPGGGLVSVTRTEQELSIVCPEAGAPIAPCRETGLRGFAVEGPLAFDATGVLAALLAPLAAAGIPVFVVSSFDTDFVFVRERFAAAAVQQWHAAGHSVAEG